MKRLFCNYYAKVVNLCQTAKKNEQFIVFYVKMAVIRPSFLPIPSSFVPKEGFGTPIVIKIGERWLRINMLNK